ncbi:MAG TPA: hypothetical protein VK666_19800 [Chryseolinea sp.]|nr:hypothetical protein [Chryseolinea sp.]
MRCLLFSLFSLLLVRCASEYHQLKPVEADNECASRIVPHHTSSSWYSASIDVVGRHLSGLLFIKNLPDSTWRIVFTNEVGVTFLDVGFLNNGKFKVYKVVSQLNKKPVLTTLRKDFELILGLPFRDAAFERFIAGDEVYFGVKQKNETAYFITQKDCASLQRMERGSARKRIVSVTVSAPGYPSPEQIELKHYTFDLQIKLTRIKKE